MLLSILVGDNAVKHHQLLKCFVKQYQQPSADNTTEACCHWLCIAQSTAVYSFVRWITTPLKFLITTVETCRDNTTLYRYVHVTIHYTHNLLWNVYDVTETQNKTLEIMTSKKFERILWLRTRYFTTRTCSVAIIRLSDTY